MKNFFYCYNKIISLFTVIFITLHVHAQSIEKTFEFGPGTSNHHSNYRTFYVPARSDVALQVFLNQGVGAVNPIPVVIEIYEPSATNQNGSGGPFGNLKATVETFANVIRENINISGVSDYGCPASWRVKVRTANNQAPLAKVFGRINFVYSPPPRVTLDMEGGTQHLSHGETKTRTLVSSNIKGTGTFTIKAKWHTDPLSVGNFGKFFPLTVSLIKPNGVTAITRSGFSQHAASHINCLGCPDGELLVISYRVTPADALLTGDWKIKMTNNSGVRIVDFDIDRGLDPNTGLNNFISTFTAKCF